MLVTGIRTLLIASVVLLVGCLPTLHPLATNQNSIFDPAFLGVWIQPGQSTTWSVTHNGDHTFRVVHSDHSNPPGQFIGRLAKINDSLFLDLMPDEATQKRNSIERIHTVATHTLYRVELKENELVVFAIDFDRFKPFLDKHPDQLPSVKWGDRMLITASTKELAKFVSEQEDMFSRPMKLVREFR